MTAAIMRLRLCGFVVLGVAIAAPAFAQTAAEPVPEKIAPGAKPAQNLSDKLSKSNGVVQPKEVDSGIEKPAPKADDPNVLKPPGANGGSAEPQAK